MASCSDTTCSAYRVGRAPYSLLKMAPGAQALEKRALAHGEECLENLPVFRAEEEGIFFSATELRSIQPTHPKSNILIRWSRRNPCLTQFDCSNVADWQQRAAVRNEFVMNNTAGTGNEHVRPPVVADDVARNSGDQQRARLLKTMVLPLQRLNWEPCRTAATVRETLGVGKRSAGAVERQQPRQKQCGVFSLGVFPNCLTDSRLGSDMQFPPHFHPYGTTQGIC